MREGWEIRKLGDACILTMGQSPESSTYNEAGNGMPFFQGCADFGTIHPTITTFCSAPKKIAEVDDVLMSVRAPIGTLNVANVQCCIGRGLASIRQKPGITIYKYLYYFISKSKKRLQDLGTGATFKAIGKDTLVSFLIPIPPIQEQEKIVAELDCLTGIIEKKKQQLEELDKLAQSIFYEMFGDPITNEKGWKTKPMRDAAPQTAYKGSIPSRDGKYWLLNLDMVEARTGAILDEIYYDEKEIGGSTTTFNEEMVLYSKLRPYLNKVVLPMKPGYGTSELVPLLPDKSALNRVFLAYLLRSHSFVAFINLKVAGAKMPRVSLDVFRRFPVILPPLNLQNEFAEKIEAIEKQKELVRRSIVETETLFNSRMDYWFN